MTEFINEINPSVTIFYNGSHISPQLKGGIDNYSHIEIESLPSGGWGYMHFPTTVRYARNLGKDCLGMTGKFHTYWGDFHSFKNLAALQYECFHMLAQNTKCSIGDQLDPNGKISKEVYDLIGKVYSEVEKKEPWCEDAKAVCEIAVFTPEEFIDYNSKSPFGLKPSITGVTRMLQEASLQFDIIDSSMEFSKYKLLVLPEERDSKSPFGLKPSITGVTRMLQEASLQFDIIDSSMEFSKYKLLVLPEERVIVNDDFKNKIEKFIKDGGKIIAVYEGGLNEEKTRFNIPSLKVKYEGKGEFTPTFVVPEGKISKDLYNTEYVMYEDSSKVSVEEGGEVLCNSIEPYFNRTPEHFCSHQHAPSSGKIYGPAIIKGDNSIYFAHKIFSQYHNYGSVWCKKLFINAIDTLLENRLVNHNGPSTIISTIYFAHKIFSQYHNYGSVWCKKLFINAIDTLLENRLVNHNGPSTIISTLNEQENENRYVLHLLHYIPERRCQRIDVIEDVIPLYNLEMKLNLDKLPKSVTLVPQNEEVKFSVIDGTLEFTVDKINGHQMVEINY